MDPFNSDNLEARGRELGTNSLIDIETLIFGFANERFLKLYLKSLVEFRCLSLANSPFVHFE